MSEDSLRETYLGRIAVGILKIILAGIVAGILSTVNIPTTGSIGGQNIDLTVVVEAVKVFAPLLLLLSGLRDLGVRI